jgi:hypothetical protein
VDIQLKLLEFSHSFSHACPYKKIQNKVSFCNETEVLLNAIC